MNKNKNLLFIANWKMNKTASEASIFLNELLSNIAFLGNSDGFNKKIVLCVPFTAIFIVANIIKNYKATDNIFVGAQNCYFEKNGAYTGEISANMLKDLGVDYVILGHSERRSLFHETDEEVNKKVLACLACGLKTVICVGEDISQKNKDLTEDIIDMQVKNAIYRVDAAKIGDIIFAYEPVWAIGEGRCANVTDIANATKFIKKSVSKMYDIPNKAVKVVYGGSLNSTNCAEIFSIEDLDGGLIGGASLDCKNFLNIIMSV